MTNSPTSTEQVIERLSGQLFHHAVTKYDPAAAERCKRQAIADLEALSRNTPADSEVERVAKSNIPDEAIYAAMDAMQNAVIYDDEGEFPRLFDLLDFSGENKARTVTQGLASAAVYAAAPHVIRAALASLSPKPVDGEVAELVKLLRRFEEVYGAARGMPWIGVVRPEQAFARAADMLLTLSRKSEPTVSEAMIEEGRKAYRGDGEWMHADTREQLEAMIVTKIYLAMQSAHEKEKDRDNG